MNKKYMSYIFRSQIVNIFYRKIFISLKFITFLIVISFGYLNAQDNDIDPQANYVIASSLRLRESPNKDAKILTNIPFGSHVEYLTNQCYNKDTTLVPLYDDDYVVVGSWVYVKYKNIKGFVLNSYLSYYSKPAPPYVQMNSDFLYLSPGCDCNFNIHNVTKYMFYGFYKLNNDSFLIKKIKVSYIADHENDITCPLILSAIETKDLEFIIGSKTEIFKDKSSILNKKVEILYNKDDDQLAKELKRVGLTLLFNPNKNRDDFFELIYSKDNKKQKLNLAEFNFPTKIKFIGDLDNDGKYDFIISYGETAGPTILYLSSQANENELLKMVASSFSSYCC